MIPFSAPPELPSIAVTYRQATSEEEEDSPNLSSSHKDKERFPTLNRTAGRLKTLFRQASHSHSHSNSHSNSHSHSHSPNHMATSPARQPSFKSYLEQSRKFSEEKDEEEEEKDSSGGETSRRVSSDSDSMGEMGESMSLHGPKGYGVGKSDSFGRPVRPMYYGALRRSGSNETVSSQSTLVAPKAYDLDDSTMDLVDLITPRHQSILTQSRILQHTKSEARRQREREQYVYKRKDRHREMGVGDRIEERNEDGE